MNALKFTKATVAMEMHDMKISRLQRGPSWSHMIRWWWGVAFFGLVTKRVRLCVFVHVCMHVHVNGM